MESADKVDFLLMVPVFLPVDGLGGMGGLELFFSFLIPDVEGVSWIMMGAAGSCLTPFKICDPPYDFDAKGDSTLTTHLHFTTKEIGFSTLNVCPGAHFISKLFCFIGHT